MPRFEVDAVLDAAADERRHACSSACRPCTHAWSARPGAAELGRLRLCVQRLGAAAAPTSTHRFEAASGQRVLERYGMTETVMLVSNPYDGERRAGTVGLPAARGRAAPRATGGEILVRGPERVRRLPQPARGHAPRPFDADGWFRTGDLGALDADGYLRIVGRAKELIITGGYNVYPREVEDVLRLASRVVDAAVVGTPTAEWGEVVTAYVELDHGAGSAAGGPTGGLEDCSTRRRFAASSTIGWPPTSGRGSCTSWRRCPATPSERSRSICWPAPEPGREPRPGAGRAGGRPMGMLDGKVAIVTGGGRGLGRSHALLMARGGRVGRGQRPRR